MNTDKIRLENLNILFGLEGGTATAFAEKVGIARPALSSILNGKPMSSRNARRIERSCDRALGWMDKRHGENEISSLYKPEALKAAIGFIHQSAPLQARYNKMNVESKTALLDKFYTLFCDDDIRSLPTSALNNLLKAVENENIKRGSNGEINGT